MNTLIQHLKMKKKFNRERKMIGDEMRKANALYHNAIEKLKKVAARNKQLRRATGSSEQLKQIKARVRHSQGLEICFFDSIYRTRIII